MPRGCTIYGTTSGMNLLLFAFFLAAAKASVNPVICSNKNGKLFARNSFSCPPGSQVWRGAGANLFDIFWVASSGQGREKFGFNYSLSELRTARAAGIRVFRAFASDWGPNKLFWKQHTDQFVFLLLYSVFATFDTVRTHTVLLIFK